MPMFAWLKCASSTVTVVSFYGRGILHSLYDTSISSGWSTFDIGRFSSKHPAQAFLDPTRVALLIETRPIPLLPPLLTHFMSVIPPSWTFRFLGSAEAISLLNSSSTIRGHINSGKLLMTPLPAQYIVDSGESISATLTDITFYRDLLAPAEWLLMFQTDSMVCSAAEMSLDDWVSAGYSWLGAPWNLGVRGGNGGLSLRHVPPIISILEGDAREANDVFEDRWLCDRLQLRDDTNMPYPNVTKQFAVESVWAEKPFGYHLRGSGRLVDASIWGDPKQKKAILEYCPEVKMILETA